MATDHGRKAGAVGWTATRRRLLGGAAGMFVAAVAPAGCTRDARPGSRLGALRARGVARLALANEEPFGFVDAAGRPTGAMPQIAAAVLTRLGVARVEPVSTNFARLIDTLLDDRADLIAAGMSITDDRCRQVTFVGPDFSLPQALGVAVGNPLRLTDYRSVAAAPGARLGVLGGAVEAGYAAAAGVRASHILPFLEQEELVTAVISGDIAAFGLTSLSTRMLVSQARPGALEATASFWAVVDGVRQQERGAMAFNPDHDDFAAAYAAKATELRRAGELAAILRRWGFRPDEAGAPDAPVNCPD
ncbi:transporter substrate-binding domain-containing protein [Pilimelia columellifera]|uniref:Ectoine/hydroxyectoine ABC transporter substrate-binding protein EhuB n=1 Tax=Pilimelia columellifera subsp. columellifera TaxID=706583 RepID=A0ABN3NLS8_9ACTN